MRHGFSLIELSIVLVILGLLTGGILAGQSLIRASELRATAGEYERYSTAVQSFRDKYFSLPGDFPQATTFWGKDNTNCTADSGTAGTPGTCNGDGNGNIMPPAAVGTGELFQFWKQLALAGLIEGSYTGISGAAGAQNAITGTNVPKSRLSNAAWAAGYWGSTGDVNSFAPISGTYGNIYVFGAMPTTPDLPVNPVLKAEEAWNLDTKLDDGKPGTGDMIAYKNSARPQCTTTDLANTAEYVVSSASIGCNLFFKLR